MPEITRTPGAHPDDNSIEIDLNSADWMLLWSLRKWFKEYPGGRFTEDMLYQTFMQTDALPALSSLEGVLENLRANACHRLDFRRLGLTRVSQDERLILAILAAAQHGRLKDARAYAASLLPPAAAWSLVESAQWLGEALLRSDQALTDRGPESDLPRGALPEDSGALETVLPFPGQAERDR